MKTLWKRRIAQHWCFSRSVLIIFLFICQGAFAEVINEKSLNSQHRYLFENPIPPNAQLAEVGQLPEFSLDGLLYVTCIPNIQLSKQPSCIKNYLTGKPYLLKELTWFGQYIEGVVEGLIYRIKLTDGKQYDIWQTKYWPRLLDGSKVIGGCIENDYAQPYPTPWGAVIDSNTLHYGYLDTRECFYYYKRVAMDGHVIWANSYVIRAKGNRLYRGKVGPTEIVETDPLVALSELNILNGAPVGFLGYIVPSLYELGSGAVTIGIDMDSGELLANQSYIKAIPAEKIASIFAETMQGLIRAGSIEEKDIYTIEDVSRKSTYLTNKQDLFDAAFKQLLIKRYFEQGTQK